MKVTPAMSSRVFVTGGTGFVGKEVIRKLVAEGYEVLALARTVDALPHDKKVPLVRHILKGDLAQLTTPKISAFMKEHSVDVVIHLAAVMNFYPEDEEHMWNINVEGTRKLAEASIEAGVKKVIYVSSTEAMGARPTPTSCPLIEEDPCIPHFVYGHTKRKAEDVLRGMGPKLPYVILRLTGVYGPGDNFAIYELLQSISYGLFFFVPKGDGKIMFIHIDDAVRGIMCTIPERKNILGNTYIISPDNCKTYSEAITFACQKLHRISPFMKLPIPVIRVITQFIGPVLNLGKKKIFLFKTETIDRMGEDRWYSNEKAKKELGFRPKYTFEGGLQHTINYMIQKGEVNTWYISPVMLFFLVCLLGTVYMLK
eukprot:Phypoly_transcript_08905.p1 GENE.Phypoly_transcript_08905~~Phypoly_transcript_08905.p1  ORF type:complete len:369 (-),score=40.47 Phypoly_transcript_08905:281-1387(-)